MTQEAVFGVICYGQFLKIPKWYFFSADRHQSPPHPTYLCTCRHITVQFPKFNYFSKNLAPPPPQSGIRATPLVGAREGGEGVVREGVRGEREDCGQFLGPPGTSYRLDSLLKKFHILVLDLTYHSHQLGITINFFICKKS